MTEFTSQNYLPVVLGAGLSVAILAETVSIFIGRPKKELSIN